MSEIFVVVDLTLIFMCLLAQFGNACNKQETVLIATKNINVQVE